MKSYLFVCFFAAAIMAIRGYRTFEDPADEGPTKPPTAPPVKPPEKPNPHGCDCDEVCDDLHNDRIPEKIQDEHKYLSYENYPVLCRDASAILLPPGGKEKKKYVCKQTFDCCRDCNNRFYRCSATKINSFGFCMRGAYKCMCECIDRKSFAELPFQPAQPAIPGPANPGPANPGPANPGPANPGPANPGPANPGPANPGPANPGPATEAPTEAPTTPPGRK